MHTYSLHTWLEVLAWNTDLMNFLKESPLCLELFCLLCVDMISHFDFCSDSCIVGLWTHMQFERKDWCTLLDGTRLKSKDSCQAASVANNLNHNEWDTFPHSKNTTREHYKSKLTLILACGWIYVHRDHHGICCTPKWLRFFNDSFYPCFHGDVIWFR